MNLFTPINDAEIQRMVFRRQFVLAPRKLDKFSHWQIKSVAGKWTVHVHPDLGLTQVTNGPLELTLLGYCLNPDQPEQTDEEICSWLLAGAASIKDIVTKTSRLVGRWVMVFCQSGELFLFSDACGLRTLSYAENRPDGPWCFSQAEAVKDVLNLRSNREAEDLFFSTRFYLICREHWWPGYDTHYEGVKRLPPNHYLDVRNGKVIRFWPQMKLQTKSPEEALPEAAELLRGALTAAARRFPLALPLTSGWDSRLVLAASRPFSKDIFYYTLKYNSHKQDQRDLVIPPRLLAKLGLPHHLVECPAGMAKSFARVFYGNVNPTSYAHGPIVFGLFRNFPQDRVCLKAMCSEIARCYYHRYVDADHLDARELTAMAQGRDYITEYGIRHFGRWLNETRPVAEAYNYKILDIFHWEQKVANSVAANEASTDLVYEMLAIYNCRALLETLLAVPARYRRHPNYFLYRKLIAHLWSETLLEPINPISLAEQARLGMEHCEKSAKTVLKRLKLFDTTRRIYRRLKSVRGVPHR